MELAPHVQHTGNRRVTGRSGPEVAGRRLARSHLRRPILLRGEDDRRLLPAVLRCPQGQAGKRQLLPKLRRRPNARASVPASGASQTRLPWRGSTPRRSRKSAGYIETAPEIPSLEDMASKAGLSAFSFSPALQDHYRRDAARLCERSSRQACPGGACKARHDRSPARSIAPGLIRAAGSTKPQTRCWA